MANTLEAVEAANTLVVEVVANTPAVGVVEGNEECKQATAEAAMAMVVREEEEEAMKAQKAYT